MHEVSGKFNSQQISKAVLISIHSSEVKKKEERKEV